MDTGDIDRNRDSADPAGPRTPEPGDAATSVVASSDVDEALVGAYELFPSEQSSDVPLAPPPIEEAPASDSIFVVVAQELPQPMSWTRDAVSPVMAAVGQGGLRPTDMANEVWHTLIHPALARLRAGAAASRPFNLRAAGAEGVVVVIASVLLAGILVVSAVFEGAPVSVATPARASETPFGLEAMGASDVRDTAPRTEVPMRHEAGVPPSATGTAGPPQPTPAETPRAPRPASPSRASPTASPSRAPASRPPTVNPPRPPASQPRPATVRAPAPHVAATPPGGRPLTAPTAPPAPAVVISPVPGVGPALPDVPTQEATIAAASRSPALAEPVAPGVAPSLGPAPLSPPAPPLAAPSPARPRSLAVQHVVNRYRDAFNALDPKATQAVWPSVDTKALTRAFDRVEEQVFDLGTCEISVIGARAVASCGGTLKYVPKVGSRNARVEQRRWQFNLREVDDAWSIDSVVTR